MNDEQIIELFFSRSQQAITELDRKYGQMCHCIAYNILHNNQDVEECVNDAYLGVWNAVPPQKPSPLSSFVAKITRNISTARYHYNMAEKRSSFYTDSLTEAEEIIPSHESAETACNLHELTQAIAEFLDTLSVENRVIFMRRYWFCDSYEDISKRIGITVKNVSVRLARIRKSLKSHLEERGTMV